MPWYFPDPLTRVHVPAKVVLGVLSGPTVVLTFPCHWVVVLPALLETVK
jgi:hypothetical protein